MAKKKQTSSGGAKKTNTKKDLNTDIKLPKDFEKKSKARFNKNKNIEISFAQFLKLEKLEYQQKENLKQNPSTRYKPRLLPTMTPCGNGDFERELDITQWQGAYGFVHNAPANFIEGIIGGPINHFDSHQTWVSPDPDPNVPINTTAPNSNGAVRIGNSQSRFGAELISKTFVVTPDLSTINFWYATVMENPKDHPLKDQPFFWVRVTDTNGAIVPKAFDFGGGSDKLIADEDNPFFKSAGEIVYKDWSCAQIDLSSQIGNQVTIEFITRDCGQGAHWGYAYIDRFCGTCEGSPTGTLNYDCDGSDHCGPGELCFDYTLPWIEDNKANIITGSLEIKLDIYQNGSLISSLSSPTLSSSNRYCFAIDPSSLPGINNGLGGIDFVATGEFSIFSISLGNRKIGVVPHGINPGQNNDYQIVCKTCSSFEKEQEVYLQNLCTNKVNQLAAYKCNCSGAKGRKPCGCPEEQRSEKVVCEKVKLPKIEPLISVSWGDSPCDCMETTDLEVACITVCNKYENVSFENFTINKIIITDEFGNPVDTLPNGNLSVEALPSGPICFGEIPPCSDQRISCKSRELVIKTIGAKSGKYRLELRGICYQTRFNQQKDFCFDLKLCGD